MSPSAAGTPILQAKETTSLEKYEINSMQRILNSKQDFDHKFFVCRCLLRNGFALVLSFVEFMMWLQNGCIWKALFTTLLSLILMEFSNLNVHAADLSLGDYEEGLPGLYHLRKVPKKICPKSCSWDPSMNHIAHSNGGMDKYVWELITATNNHGMSLSSARRRRATAILMKDMFLSCNEGDIVETGVFTGGTAAVIVRMLIDFDHCNRTLWAFDSFEGLPDRDAQVTLASSQP